MIVGVSLGSLFGGLLYASVGGACTFFWFAVMSSVVFVLHVIVQYVLSKRHGVADVAFQQETKGELCSVFTACIPGRASKNVKTTTRKSNK
jgi:heme exporter protein D